MNTIQLLHELSSYVIPRFSCYMKSKHCIKAKLSDFGEIYGDGRLDENVFQQGRHCHPYSALLSAFAVLEVSRQVPVFCILDRGFALGGLAPFGLVREAASANRG